MTYQEARNYLKEVSRSGCVLGLESIRNLLMELGNPQDHLKFIHIAGTNGKGSVSAYLSTVLSTAGYKTGRFLSPAVLSELESIQVDEKNISEGLFAIFVLEVKQAISYLLEKGLPHPTVFEIEVAIAFLHFKQEKCDLVVLETGMGGLNDATNVVDNTLAAVFTTVGKDHIEYFGDTVAKLTTEKAGIIKPNSQVVMGNLPAEAETIIKQMAQKQRAPFHKIHLEHMTLKKPSQRFEQIFSYKNLGDFTIKMLGNHQIENAILAIEVIESLKARGVDISTPVLKAGLARTKWLGRTTIIQNLPIVIVDGAHNHESIKALKEVLIEYFPDQKIVGVMGVFKDKEIEIMLEEMEGVIEKIHAIALPNKERTMDAKELKEHAEAAGIQAEVADSTGEAIEKAIHDAGKDGVVVTFGSLSYLGEVFDYFASSF